MGHLLENIPDELPEELFETILAQSDFKLERIVSRGHATPAGHWYDQVADEWVLLVKGCAGLRIENQEEEILLQPGDYILLPAHCRHRVEWTDPENDTIWLVLHYLPRT